MFQYREPTGRTLRLSGKKRHRHRHDGAYRAGGVRQGSGYGEAAPGRGVSFLQRFRYRAGDRTRYSQALCGPAGAGAGPDGVQCDAFGDPHAARGHACAGLAEQGAARRVSRRAAPAAADDVALARRQAAVSEILAGRFVIMPRLTRRTVLGAALLPALAVRRASAAVQFNRPIRVVSPYAAGGVGENIMHLLAVSMEPQLGQK